MFAIITYRCIDCHLCGLSLMPCYTVIKPLPIKLHYKMDTSKMSPEQESEIRFDAWKKNIEIEIDEQRSLAASFLAGIQSDDVSIETKLRYLRLGAAAVAQYEHLKQCLDDALTIRTFRKK